LTERILTDKILADENFDRQEFSPTETTQSKQLENQGKLTGKMQFCISILSFFRENCLILLEFFLIKTCFTYSLNKEMSLNF
jgi:hypothetical protein